MAAREHITRELVLFIITIIAIIAAFYFHLAFRVNRDLAETLSDQLRECESKVYNFDEWRTCSDILENHLQPGEDLV